MPVVKFTRDVGHKWKMGQVVNLPTSTLKSMAKSDGVESYLDFSTVQAIGSNCVKYMRDRKEETQIAESVLSHHPEAAPVKRKRGRPRVAKV